MVRVLSGAGQREEARNLLDLAVSELGSESLAARRLSLMLENERAVIELRSGAAQAAAQSFGDLAGRSAAMLGQHHPQTLTALHNQGVALWHTASRTEALALFETVAALRAAVLGPNHPDTLVTRSFRALQEAEAGRAEHWLPELRAVLALACGALGDRHTFVLQIAGRLANAEAIAGDLRGALATLREWAMRARDSLGPRHIEAAALLHEYAGALRNAGKLAEARDIYAELAEATRREKGPDDVDTLASYNNLAVVASDLGDMEGAERIYRMMLEVFDRLGPAQVLNRVSVENNLGHLLLGDGRLAEARRLFESVLAVRLRRLEPGHRLTLLSRSNLAAALAKEGRSAEALDQHRQIHGDRERLFGPAYPDTLSSLHNLASTLEELGRPGEAIPLLERAVATRLEALGATHHDTIASMRVLAGALLSDGRRIDAEAAYRRIVHIVEELRTQGGLPDDLIRSQFAQYVPAYRRLALLRAERGDAEATFDLAELIKARSPLEKSSARGPIRERLLSAPDLGALQALERRIAALDLAIAGAANPVGRNALVAERDAALREWRTVDGRLRAESPAFSRASEATALVLAEAQLRLGEDDGSISYVVSGNEVAAVWFTRAAAGAMALGSMSSLVSAVETCRWLLADPGLANDSVSSGKGHKAAWRLPDGTFCLHDGDTGPQAGAQRVKGWREVAAGLSDILIEPLPDAAFAVRRLIVSPDGPLAALPFEVLERRGISLLSMTEVSYALSLSVDLATQEATQDDPKNRIPLMAIGDPAMDGAPVWSELPGAAAELASVADLFGLRDGETLFRREAANLGTIRALENSGRLARATTLLFSAHGVLDPKEPLRSAIVLAPDPAAPQDGGLLTAGELATYRLGCHLIVLSACDTGAGSFLPGGGIMGLPFALRVAGARSTVQTLWPIFDEQAAAFTKHFFAHMHRGASAVSSLTLTKREAAAGQLGEVLRHPCFWAPFLVYGR